MAPATVAVVAEKAIWAKFTDTKTSALAQRNDVHTGVPAFVFAMLVPAYVIPLVLVDLQRKIINFFTGQVSQFSLKRNYFWRGLRERNHSD